MNDAASLTLPKAGARARRRRLPRPPKFTRRQKMLLAWDVAALVLNLALFLGAARLWNVAMMATAALDIRLIVREALAGRWMRPWSPDVLVTYGMWCFALVLMVLGA